MELKEAPGEGVDAHRLGQRFAQKVPVLGHPVDQLVDDGLGAEGLGVGGGGELGGQEGEGDELEAIR